jgi:seryl-tRNA synthetase
MGEYVYPDERVGPEDRRQNVRLRELEGKVTALQADNASLWKMFNRLETALIGHDGKNGIRGTMQEQYNSTNGRLEKLDSKIDDVNDSVSKLALDLAKLASSMATATRVFGGVATIVGVIWIVIQIADFFN